MINEHLNPKTYNLNPNIDIKSFDMMEKLK